MSIARIATLFSVGVVGLLGSGCSIDITPTLPPQTFNYDFPLLGGVPIVGELFLPSIDVCDVFSEEALSAEIEGADGINFIVQLLLDRVEIENVSVIRVVMQATEPDGASFEGLTEVAFLENDEVILSATPGDGIDGGQVVLSTDDPTNLIEIINACPERASNIRVRVTGVVPLNSPTQWTTTATVRLAARASLF